MSREAMEAVQDHSTIRDPYGRLVFIAIARFVGPRGEAGYPSVRTIAEKAGCDKNTVTSWTSKLEEAGELTTRKEGKGRGTRIYYTINLPFDSDNIGGMYEPSSDNNGSDNNSGMSETDKLLSEQVALLSEQVALLSERLSDNVLPLARTETLKPPEETTETGGGETPAPTQDNDQAVIDLMRANDLPSPETAEEWDALRSPEGVTWILATGHWPGYEVLGKLRGKLGQEPSEECLQKAWELWCLSGYKKSNVLGVLDFYNSIKADPGWLPSDRFKPSTNGHNPNTDDIEAMKARVAAKLQEVKNASQLAH